MKEVILKFLEKGNITNIKSSKGDTEIMFQCPFHNDSSASLQMNTIHGMWRCYGCGKKGSFKKFIYYLTGEYVELEHIMSVEEQVQAKIRYAYQQSTKNMFQHEEKIKFLEYSNLEFMNFVDIIKSSEATEYLKIKRKLTDKTINKFKLKYAIKGEYQGRIIIPYYKDQCLVGFNSRLITVDKTKGKDFRYRYCVNSKEFEGFIYNSENVSFKKPVFIVEGPFDLMWMVQNGFYNTISTLNTSVKIEHLEFISEFNTLIFVFDNDKNHSGYNSLIKATELILKIYPNKNIYYADLPVEKDPNECSKEELLQSFKILKKLKIKEVESNIK